MTVIMSDLRHPRFAPLYKRLEAHIEGIANVFFSEPSASVNQTNWVKHMLHELISDIPNQMLRTLDRKLEEMIKPQLKRRRCTVPDTLYVVYTDPVVCDHIRSIAEITKNLISEHNNMMQTEMKHGTSIAILVLMRERIENLLFLLSRTSWRPPLICSPRFLVPNFPVVQALMPQNFEEAPLKPNCGALDTHNEGLKHLQQLPPSFYVDPVRVKMETKESNKVTEHRHDESISATLKKECSPPPCLGGAPCPST